MRLSGIVQKMFHVNRARTRKRADLDGLDWPSPSPSSSRSSWSGQGACSRAAPASSPTRSRPEQAIPTTTALIALFNGEPDGGRTYFIDQLAFSLLSGTPAAGASLFAAVSPGKIAPPPTAMATGYGVGRRPAWPSTPRRPNGRRR
jgi:hypothetical protein